MNRRKAALPVAGGLALALSAAFSPFMKHSIDAGLGNSAKAALVSKGVNGVKSNSNWASLNLKGPGSSKTAALAAVHTMTHGNAVNKVTYTCTGSGPCPGGNGSSVNWKDIAANGSTSGAGATSGAGSANGTGSANAGAGTGGAAGSGTGASGAGTGNGAGANGSGSGNGGASGSGSGAKNGSGASGSASGNGSGAGASGSGSSGSGSGNVPGENTNVEAQIKQALGSAGVTFAPNSANLTPHAQTVLDRIAQILGKAPKSKVTVAGYTDNQGSAAHNLALSKARAQATRSYLAAHGVAASRMAAAGHGAADPIATNATNAGRAQNRRIDFTVQGG